MLQNDNNNENKIRIAKRIADLGYCSRREAEKLIFSSKVKVNDNLINTPAYFVNKNDIIFIDGKVIATKNKKTRLFMYYKPKGLICSYKDEQGRPTIFDDLYQYEGLPRLVYVGRLDYNSEGLLLLSNNGELASILTSSNLELPRTYKVRAFGNIKQDQLDALSFGVVIEGIRYKPIIANIISKKGSNIWLEFTLKEGKNREIRKICEYLGLSVNRLIRTAFSNYTISNMNPGELAELDIATLRKVVGEKTYQSIVNKYSD